MKTTRGSRGVTIVATLVVSASILFAAGCVMSQNASREVGENQLDHRLLRHTYVEDGSLVLFAVNTDAARRRENAPYIPLAFVIANNDVAHLSVDRESLTLVDDTGRRYPMATVEEVKSLGNRTVQDLRASSSFAGIFTRRLVGRPYIDSVFYPIQVSELGYQRRGLVADTIELPRHNWMIDVVYFPHPEGELLGRRYELWYATRELEEPVFVKFAIE